MSNGTRYRLAFNASGAPHADTISHGDFQTLAGALAAAWASHTSGCRPLSITCGGLPVMGEDDLRQAVERLRTVESECPENGKIGCAAHVLREMGLE